MDKFTKEKKKQSPLMGKRKETNLGKEAQHLKQLKQDRNQSRCFTL